MDQNDSLTTREESNDVSKGVLEDEGLLFLVLNFCDTQSRSNFVFVSSWHATSLTSESSYKWRLERLHIEKGIYHPPRLPPNKTWQSLYFDLLVRSTLWEGGSRRPKGSSRGAPVEYSDLDKFKIQVCARFKPKGLDEGGRTMTGVASGKKRITLPLHQRLALIRMGKNLGSNKEALEVLGNQGGWFGGRWGEVVEEEKRDLPHDSSGKENDYFATSYGGEGGGKYPPGSGEEGEAEAQHQPRLSGGVHTIDHQNDRVIIVDPTKGLREFALDSVLADLCTQRDVYDSTTMTLVGDFLNGYNATCLVYGQTGSGKTHTMFGLDERDNEVVDSDCREGWGIVPRACSEVMEALEYRRKHLNVNLDSSVSVSYIEIYGNDVTDLLRNGSACGHSKVAAQRYVLDGSAEVSVESMEDIVKLLHVGEGQKRKAATAMNQRSSRAHTLFVMTLRQRCAGTGVSSTSRLFLADLGGSEQVKKSQALRDSSNLTPVGDEGGTQNRRETIDQSNAERMQEAVFINLGLLAFKQCVKALNSRRRKHIPYADSKLTMMLSSGLGGDSKTSVIVCAAQEEEHGPETIDAIKFGQSCSRVSKATRNKVNMLKDLLDEIDTAIATCEANIQKHERWEVREQTRIDEFAGSGESKVETRKTTVLVGAESYRRELEQLLRRKAELTGTEFEDSSTSKGAPTGFGNAYKYGMGKRFAGAHNEWVREGNMQWSFINP